MNGKITLFPYKILKNMPVNKRPFPMAWLAFLVFTLPLRMFFDVGAFLLSLDFILDTSISEPIRVLYLWFILLSVADFITALRLRMSIMRFRDDTYANAVIFCVIIVLGGITNGLTSYASNNLNVLSLLGHVISSCVYTILSIIYFLKRKRYFTTSFARYVVNNKEFLYYASLKNNMRGINIIPEDVKQNTNVKSANYNNKNHVKRNENALKENVPAKREIKDTIDFLYEMLEDEDITSLTRSAELYAPKKQSNLQQTTIKPVNYAQNPTHYQSLPYNGKPMKTAKSIGIKTIILILIPVVVCILIIAGAFIGKLFYDMGKANAENYDAAGFPVVYVTQSGKSYHVRQCSYIKDKKVIRLSLTEAQKTGYSPCSKCNPHKNESTYTSKIQTSYISQNENANTTSEQEKNTKTKRERINEILKSSGYIPQEERTYVLPPLYEGDQPVEVSYDAYKYIKDAETNEEIIEGFQNYLSANDRYSDMKSYKKHDEEEMRKVASYIEKFKQKYGEHQKDIVSIEISSK